ncbi:MAG: class I SAM-dependent methyltransferase [bacterium]|jgi:SAM-dependent methyltransferase
MKCRLCGGGDLRLYYTQGSLDQYKFYKCDTCKLVNLDLSQGMDQAKYTEAYVDPTDMNEKQNMFQKATYDFIRSRLRGRGRLLDIGCGNGRLLLEAFNDGWQVEGLELSAAYAEAIRSELGIEVAVTDLFDFDIPEERFVLVVMRHVLEHIPDSIAALRKIRDLLAPGGSAVLEFPNIEAPRLRWKRFLRNRGIYRKRYRDGYSPGHCNEFCRDSFSYLLDKTGFRLAEWQTYSSSPMLNPLYGLTGTGATVRALIQKGA